MAMFAVPRGEPVFREEDCSLFDIGLVYSTFARFSDADKFQFIQNIYGRLTLIMSSLSLRKLVENFANSSQNV